MIRIYSISFIISVFCLLTASCNNSEKDNAQTNITNAIKELQLPAKLDNNMTLIGCSFGDNTLTFRCETSQNIDTLKRKNEVLKRLQHELLSRKLKRELIKAGSSLQYIYINNGDSAVIKIFPEEMHSI